MKRTWLSLILALIGTVGAAIAEETAGNAQQPTDTTRRYVDAFLKGDMQTLLDHASPPLKQLMKDAVTLRVLRDQSVGGSAQTVGEQAVVMYTRQVRSAGGESFTIIAQVAPDGELVGFSVTPAGLVGKADVAQAEAQVRRIETEIERLIAKELGTASDAANQNSRLSKAFDKKSPFAAVRWQDSQPEVKVGGEWFQLVSLDGIATSDIVAFSRRAYKDNWRMRFEEDLVELLSRLGHEPKETVRLVVRPIGSSETRTLENVEMTKANRDAIKEAAMGRAGKAEAEQKAAPDKPEIDAKLRRRLVGRYQLAPDFIFTVRDQDGHLMVGITNQETQEVFPDSATRWSYRGIKAALEFQLPKTGPAKSLVLDQNGVQQTARWMK